MPHCPTEPFAGFELYRSAAFDTKGALLPNYFMRLGRRVPINITASGDQGAVLQARDALSVLFGGDTQVLHKAWRRQHSAGHDDRRAEGPATLVTKIYQLERTIEACRAVKSPRWIS